MAKREKFTTLTSLHLAKYGGNESHSLTLAAVVGLLLDIAHRHRRRNPHLYAPQARPAPREMTDREKVERQGRAKQALAPWLIITGVVVAVLVQL